MDISTLATAVTAMLTPYLIKFGEKFSEGVGKDLWDVIRLKFKDRPDAYTAASKFASDANDPDNLIAFTSQLKYALKEDPEFASEIGELVNPTRDRGISVGDIHTRDIKGSIVIGDANTIHQVSSRKSKKVGKRRNRKK